MTLGLSWRLLGREFRSGELRLLALALALAVAAVTSVGFFTDRVHQALEREAHQLLGADLLLIADHPWAPETLREAAARGLGSAETRVFPSMVTLGEQARLADIKAVSATYPLRGELRIAPALQAADAPAGRAPKPGTVWLDERLATALAAKAGDEIVVGNRRLQVEAILTQEPDRGVNFFSVAPRLMMHLDDLASTELIQTGSRVTYRLLLAGDETGLQSFRRWLEPRLGRGERVEDTQNARPEIRSALDRAQRFLGFAALLTVVLSAVAVALAARRYLQRHLDACAVMRCLGATQGLLVRLHVALFVWLALIAASLGCLFGYLTHFILHLWLAELLSTNLPQPSLLPLGQGLLTAAVLLFGFALPPILRLAKVPTLRVLRRELGVPGAAFIGGYVFGLLLLAALMLWVAGEIRLGLWSVAAFAGAAVLFTALARLGVRLSGVFRGGSRFGWRQGLANLERHAWASTAQVVALALGLMAILLLTVTRGELLAAWQKATPADAPNRFILNIQPEQVAPLRAEFLAAGMTIEPAPMIRGRLLSIAGKTVSAASFPEDERAQRLVEREFNLSWRNDLPPGNKIMAGRWFRADEVGRGVASVEEGLAKTLGIQLGDTLVFSIGGEEVPVSVVGLRKLDWDSMRVNFFVLTPAGVIDRYPASHLAAFHLPQGREDLTLRLVKRFPNLTVIDVSAILRQLQNVMEQVSRAVEFVFLFTLAAGGVVLYAALITAFDERRYELSIMRALGARRQQLRRTLIAELTAVGGLAGLIAGTGASLIGQLLAEKAFQLEMAFNPWLIPGAILAGAILSVGIGWLGMRRLLQVPPLLALRAGA